MTKMQIDMRITEYLTIKARLETIKAELMAVCEDTCVKTLETLDGVYYATYKDSYTPMETDMKEVERVFKSLGREVPKKEGSTRKPSLIVARHKRK